MSSTVQPPPKDWIRIYVTIAGLTLIFIIIATWLLIKADIQIVVKGEVDPNVFVGFLVGSVLTASIAWLFGRHT